MSRERERELLQNSKMVSGAGTEAMRGADYAPPRDRRPINGEERERRMGGRGEGVGRGGEYVSKRADHERMEEAYQSRVGHRNADSAVKGYGGTSGDYAALREKKLAEERRYREGTRTGYDHDSGYGDRYKERFRSPPLPPRGWAEEEKSLMEWTRNQAHAPRDQARARTPPIEDSPRVKDSISKSSLRSLSAPSVAPPITGIAALGKYEDSKIKRLRQLKYAEELKSQIKEKEKLKPSVAWRNKKKEEPETRYRELELKGELTGGTFHT
jgi:hypothetical protein